jgi:hypothetical protein
MAGGAEGIQRRYQDLSPVLNEQGLRRFAATEARAYGHGGVSVVSLITGLARSTISRGIKEIEQDLQLEAGRVRKPGGGRKAKQAEDSTLLSDLHRIVEPRRVATPGGCCSGPRKVYGACLRRYRERVIRFART